MIWRKPLTWKLGIASIALFAAVAVYLFARLNPPALLEPFQVANSLSGAPAGLFGSAPSFLYTLSIGLLIGICAWTPASGRMHCIAWIVLAFCLEVSQAPGISAILTDTLGSILPVSVFAWVGPYWNSGVFDPLDLFATVAGGAIALLLLTWLTKEKISETAK